MDNPRQVLQPPILHPWVVVLTRRQVAQIDGVPDGEAVVLGELLRVGGNAEADEGVVGVVEECGEGGRDGVGVEKLEDEAAAADAELEDGDGVLVVAAEAGSPLDVEADDEAVEAVAVDLLDVGDPGGDLGGAVGDEGPHGLKVDDDVVEVVGVGVELVVMDGDGRHGWKDFLQRN
ncbi:hypothetical protein TIFTF001_022432 [Ficus carica]|uniref:Uncharacterized protein n=1 Tax=Ficus carica TaxID=3494 RepID=A0AA88AJ77_FICCA|nr:hypothetical protein TIFTF001_022432 [Ficus carica]